MSTSRVVAAAKRILSVPALFSEHVIRMRLRRYQLAPLQAVVASVLGRQGLEFLLLFPRQSGKNEVVAHLLVYLLNILQRVGGNIVYGAIGDGLGRGIKRLEERLDNDWNAGRWASGTRPVKRSLGKAAVVFLSSHPQAFSRGETAHWLLVVDEMQDQDGPHLESVFTPMRAAQNATALYLGTARLTTDALWQKKRELEALQALDGRQRVFIVSPYDVADENPGYRVFLEGQVTRYGREHPIVKSEYFNEPLDGSGGLFPERRRRLMVGSHARLMGPEAGKIYAALIDVAGQDEAATDPLAQLRNPARDYTVATIVEIVPAALRAPGPSYRVCDVWVDQGSRHFEDVPGMPKLVDRLVGWLERWGVGVIVCDGSGVGEGVTSWLRGIFGVGRVIDFSFGGTGKAWLGSAFLSLVETSRFAYFDDGVDTPLSDVWWFLEQCRHCGYELREGGQWERDLKWGVPATAKADIPGGEVLVHDDRLLSAALAAVLDDKWRDGSLRLGAGESAQIKPADPLARMDW